MPESAAEQRLQVFESRHGRDAGWLVEHDGRAIALLSDPQRVDMFIDSYRVEPLDAGDAARAAMGACWRDGELVFRSRRFGTVAPHAVALGEPDPANGRVLMRGLYLPIGDPRPWERLLLRWRAFRRRAA